MSLTGALFAGVSGLNAQTQSMAMISDNIANVNTVGYKGKVAQFNTLVTNSGSTTKHSPAGVNSKVFSNNSLQGLVQASSSPTDMAIAGKGFFVVNTQPDLTGETLYTRAGQFSADSTGNLVNAGGQFLMGWPLDENGAIPSNNADITSLDVVNTSTVSGAAVATTTVSVGVNLNATQAGLTGANVLSTAIGGVTASSNLGTAATAFTTGDDFTLQVSGHSAETFTFTSAAGANNFETLEELAAAINANTTTHGIVASVSNPTGNAQITFEAADARDTLTVTDGTGTPLATLGVATGAVAATYDATDSTKNMASGAIAPAFARDVVVFDGLGTAHSVTLSYLKMDTNTWAIEVHANPATEVTTTAPLVNGQLGAGIALFNGDGSLNSIDAALIDPMTAAWTNGAIASEFTVDWGTPGGIGVGLTDGLSQFDSAFNVAFINQNGAEVGQLNGVTVDEEGFVIASFNNGQTKKLYKLPIATFGDPNQLEGRNGNAFAETQGSGRFNLREAGTGGAGSVAPSALETANVDLADEFTKMIVTQRAFSASARVITTTDDMLDELIRIKR